MESKPEYEKKYCNNTGQPLSTPPHFHHTSQPNNYLHRGLNIAIDNQRNEATSSYPRACPQQMQNLQLQRRYQLPHQVKEHPNGRTNMQIQQGHEHHHVELGPRQLLLKVTEPPPLSVSGTGMVQSPQVWQPHEKPQPQPQLQPQQAKARPDQPRDQPREGGAAKHGDREGYEKRKQHGTASPLKHPTAKRAPHAPVTKQGWLHKQGSDGLMLWKKRWFVLSEYCLFYYKGPEEEKLLGSILLPSYKVTICGPEDKVNRKYAFKCEHVNMRTYILAADSHEVMMVWVHVLNLASLLQANDDANLMADSSSLSSPNVSTDMSDRPAPAKEVQSQPCTPAGVHAHSSSNTTEMSSPSQQELCRYKQPLYANAPPKPRRLNDTCYPSPSSDVMDRCSSRDVRQSCTYSIQRSPVELSDDAPAHRTVSPYFVQPRYDSPQYRYGYAGNVQTHMTVERRTPDTYGRSNLTVNMPHPTDYEDVYGDYCYYKAPPGALPYNVKRTFPSVGHINSTNSICSNGSMSGAKCNSPYEVSDSKKSVSMIARPHSADFLEYEMNRQEHFNYKQHPRPKSSLDINRNGNEDDRYFYSEECYAEKMRKSIQYLHTMPKYVSPSAQGTKSPIYSPALRHTDYENVVLDRLSSQSPISRDKYPTDGHRYLTPAKSRSDILPSSDLELNATPRFEGNVNKGPMCHQSLNRPSNHNQNNDQKYLRDQYDKVTKFVSARLAQSEFHIESMHEHRTFGPDSNRKREESMKRLLEWKQRMLQSPLNRKIQDSRVCVPRDHKHVHRPGTKFNNRQRPLTRKSMNSLQNTSYSSDDEDNDDRSKESIQPQAGRTLDTFPLAFESLTPAPPTSVTVHSASQESIKSLTPSLVKHNIETSKSRISDVEYGGSDDRVGCMFPSPTLEKSSFVAVAPPQTCNEHSEHSNDLDTGTVISDTKLNGALIESILSELEDHSEATDTCQSFNPTHSQQESVKDDNTENEENYIPMTPHKSILDACDSNSNFDSDYTGENPYVEMSQSIDLSLLANSSNAAEQAYEILCFQDSKMEPIYMELKNPEKLGINFKENTRLYDMLMPHKNQTNFNITKSDSSDADDEASKELHSLDAPTHPRFSLSDTFRPASYYIGTNTVLPEMQDSSFSDLVSPPSIPISHSPSDDLDTADGCLAGLHDIDSVEHSTLNQSYDYLLHSDNNSTYRLSGESMNSLNSRQRDLETMSLNSIMESSGKCHSAGFENNSNREVLSEKTASNKSLFSNINDVSEDMPYMVDVPNSEQNFSFSHDGCIVNSEDRYNYENYIIVKSNVTEKTLEGDDTKLDSIRKDESSSEGDQSHRDLQETCNIVSSDEAAISLQVQFPEFSVPQIKLNHELNPEEIPQLTFASCDASFKQSAPYYYSDLPTNAGSVDNPQMFLNNQRTLNESKKDITHIINPIKCNRPCGNIISSPQAEILDNTIKIAAEARSASVDFLNLNDKSGHIDKKNIYESDTLKRLKAYSTQHGMQPISESAKNILVPDDKIKFVENDYRVNVDAAHSYSLENLLEGVLCNEVTVQNMRDTSSLPKANDPANTISEGSYLWEEDRIWRERLRSVSQRHTKSVDDLLLAGERVEKDLSESYCVASPNSVYANGNVVDEPTQSISPQEVENANENNKTEVKRENSFILDREKLRQWDLLSSAPSDDQLSITTASQTPRGNSALVEHSEGNIIPENSHLPETASGSIILNTRSASVKSPCQKKMWNWENPPPQSYTAHLSMEQLQEIPTQPHQQSHYVPNIHYRPELYGEPANKKDLPPQKINLSAGELLGRTHEELVLLLIQLRRQSTSILHTIDNSYDEIDKIQAKLNLLDHQKKMENVQKLTQIRQHLVELEKQYEKGKPLLNLVDNMVKLGSLYRKPKNKGHPNTNITEHLEFSQQEQERRLLAEERRDWNRLHTDNLQLQQKVQQLYQLDRLIQEESGTLQSLQQDKEEIERALGGLKLRLTKGFNDPSETELAVKQQLLLENELSRVHAMLAENSKNLEETVAGNARLEQELLILRQKLQSSRHLRNSPQCSNAGDSLPCVVGSSAMLELDLQKVQQKVGDIQKQRKELSTQVRQLIDRSNSLQQQIKPSTLAHNNHCLTNKKKVTLSWRETDLDTMSVVDHGESWEDSRLSLHSPNADVKQNDTAVYDSDTRSTDVSNDDVSRNLTQQEKQQEIKTVRIVKRESERRHRDRDKSISSGKWDALLEEDCSQNSSVSFRPTSAQKTGQIEKVTAVIHNTQTPSPTICPNVTISSNKSTPEKSPELSPVFKSEAARQIITEMSGQETLQKNNRRVIPKEKRRHFTAPHNEIIMKDLCNSPLDGGTFDKNCVNERRARDDLDMERALKQRLGAPDVVHSALGKKELKYDEDTIDYILGTPNKITIPERYVPEQVPQLSVEEQEYRLRKVESIKKMLSDTAIISSSVSGEKTDQTIPNTSGNLASVKMIEEKKQREHLLQLNQILAQQVMEMSKIVAVGGNNEDEQ